MRHIPRITIEWVEGRNLDQKRMLVKLITDAVMKVDSSVKPDDVSVVFRDMAKSNFAKSGRLWIDR